MLSIKWGLFSCIPGVHSERRWNIRGFNRGNGVLSSDLGPQPRYEWIRGNSCSLTSLNEVMQGFRVTWHSQCLHGQPDFFVSHAFSMLEMLSQTYHHSTLGVQGWAAWTDDTKIGPPSAFSFMPSIMLLSYIIKG